MNGEQRMWAIISTAIAAAVVGLALVIADFNKSRSYIDLNLNDRAVEALSRGPVTLEIKRD